MAVDFRLSTSSFLSWFLLLLPIAKGPGLFIPKQYDSQPYTFPSVAR